MKDVVVNLKLFQGLDFFRAEFVGAFILFSKSDQISDDIEIHGVVKLLIV